MEIYGDTWRYIWRYMEIHGDRWKYMEIYGDIWRYMEIYGDTWRYMEIYGDIWRYYGIIWLSNGIQWYRTVIEYHGYLITVFGGVHKWGYPTNGWFFVGNRIWKWMMTGGTPILGNAQIWRTCVIRCTFRMEIMDDILGWYMDGIWMIYGWEWYTPMMTRNQKWRYSTLNNLKPSASSKNYVQKMCRTCAETFMSETLLVWGVSQKAFPVPGILSAFSDVACRCAPMSWDSPISLDPRLTPMSWQDRLCCRVTGVANEERSRNSHALRRDGEP